MYPDILANDWMDLNKILDILILTFATVYPDVTLDHNII